MNVIDGIASLTAKAIVGGIVVGSVITQKTKKVFSKNQYVNELTPEWKAQIDTMVIENSKPRISNLMPYIGGVIVLYFGLKLLGGR
jgi:hypothetical protein